MGPVLFELLSKPSSGGHRSHSSLAIRHARGPSSRSSNESDRCVNTLRVYSILKKSHIDPATTSQAMIAVHVQ
jgi:hypothetical protein